MDAKARAHAQHGLLEGVHHAFSGAGDAIVSAEHVAKQFQIYLNDRSRFLFFGRAP